LCLTAALALGTTACNLDGLDSLVSDGNDDDDDDDETDGETGGDETGDDTGNDDDDTLPSIEGGDDDPNAEGGDGPGDGDREGDEGPTADDTGAVPGDASPSCVAYCEVELACGEYYASIDECTTECTYAEVDAGACLGQLTALDACIGTLDCEQFATFFAVLQAVIEGGGTPPVFPCDIELFALAECGA
jgi:hypothetical protein